MSKTEFPLIEAMGIEVRMDYQVPQSPLPNTRGWNSLATTDKWIKASDLEKLLEGAPVVKCGLDADRLDEEPWWIADAKGENTIYTHTARLIAIQPIVRDTAESLLREFVACCEVDDPKLRWGELRRRANALLEKGEG